MSVPQEVQDLLWKVEQGDETALGYAPELKEENYSYRDTLPASSPAPFYVKSYRKVPVYGQQASTCVGNSITGALTHLALQEQDEVVIFDGEELNARVTHREGDPTSFQPVMDNLIQNGTSPLGDEGLYFPAGYANVDRTNVEAIRDAISKPGQMVVFASWLTRAFGSNPTQPLKASPGEQNMGLHAMLFVGYTADGPVVQNTWTDGWGDKGHCVLSWDYILQHCVEVMAITDLPDVAGGYIKTHQYDTYAEHAIKRTDLPTRRRPATYLVKDNGRIWITDPAQASRMGVNLSKVQTLPDTDSRWALPVIGPDAPKHLR